tara:strand:- start:431 stop:559 length:129 start_codon:yes stop_codon:yes gene_type:complete
LNEYARILEQVCSVLILTKHQQTGVQAEKIKEYQLVGWCDEI